MRVWGVHLLLAATDLGMRNAWATRVLPRSAGPSPIAIPPSQNWDGNDGPWSSFELQVGTPAQDVRAFVSTASTDTVVVLRNGCLSTDAACTEQRGRLFNPNASVSWTEHGFYQLGLDQNLNLNVQAEFGNDTVGLGVQGSGGPILKNQVVAGIASETLYLGLLGLNPTSINFSTTDQGRPTFMTNLKRQNLIPSLSYGYTAGNQYRLKQVYGSLTLGGYDSSLFTAHNLQIPFSADKSRNLLVGLQSISAKDDSGTTNTLLPTPVMINIDTTASMIWLPTVACQAFEKAFNLSYDSKSQLYLVNDDLHTALQSRNPTFTFTLGTAKNGGQTIDIVLPYNSFDLLVKPPFTGINQSQRYFPLRRASDDTQYTLGRTFLQESYLTVDWERRNFSISQSVFSNTAKQNLVAIRSIDAPSDNSLSTGAKVGIAIGVIIAIVTIVLATAFCLIRRRRRNGADNAPAKLSRERAVKHGFAKGELDAGIENARFEMDGGTGDSKGGYSGLFDEKSSAAGGLKLAEFDGSHGRHEMAGGATSFYTGRGVHEMHDPSSVPPIELLGSMPSEWEDGDTAIASPRSTQASHSPLSAPSSGPGSPFSRPPSSKPSPIHDKYGSRRAPRRPIFGPLSRHENADISSSEGPSAPSSPSQPSYSPPSGSPRQTYRVQRSTISAASADRSSDFFSPVSVQSEVKNSSFWPSTSQRGKMGKQSSARRPGQHSDSETTILSPVSPDSDGDKRAMFGRSLRR